MDEGLTREERPVPSQRHTIECDLKAGLRAERDPDHDHERRQQPDIEEDDEGFEAGPEHSHGSDLRRPTRRPAARPPAISEKVSAISSVDRLAANGQLNAEMT